MKELYLEEPTEVYIKNGDTKSVVYMGTEDALKLGKMFGPTIFCDLRIRQDLERMEWVIERSKTVEVDDGFSEEFEEWCAIPAQLSKDFICDKCNDAVYDDNGVCPKCNNKDV